MLNQFFLWGGGRKKSYLCADFYTLHTTAIYTSSICAGWVSEEMARKWFQFSFWLLESYLSEQSVYLQLSLGLHFLIPYALPFLPLQIRMPVPAFYATTFLCHCVNIRLFPLCLLPLRLWNRAGWLKETRGLDTSREYREERAGDYLFFSFIYAIQLFFLILGK